MNVLEDMRRDARQRAQREVRNCPLTPADAQRWVDFTVGRVTTAHEDAAYAWAARFVNEYTDLIGQMEGDESPDGKAIHAARVRLDWWKRVQSANRSVCGMYDAVGTRDRLRGLMRGDFDDEIDACLVIYGDDTHARRVVAALGDLLC